MRTATLTVVASALGAASAFQRPASITQTARPSTCLREYIPSGFTKDSWAAFKGKEKARKDAQAKKNLGRVGPKGFQSRSFQSFQESLERGEAAHLMPVMNAKQRVASGELKPEDIPYMQRGGNWDNSDIKGAKKIEWLNSDKDYASGGFRKEQSVSIFGYGKGLDWTGKREREGPMQKTPQGYNAPTLSQLRDQDKPKKKFFGLF